MPRSKTWWRPAKVAVGRPSPHELSDGVVRLRIPTRSDFDRVVLYGSDPSFLEGNWIPGPRSGEDLREWASAFVQELIAGWTAEGALNGGALHGGGIHGGGLIVDEREPFLGIVYVFPTSAVAVSLSYGVVPYARKRGIASRAARLAAEWALTQGGYDRVELRIAQSHHESQHVAERAGFRFVERFQTHVEATGETFEDLLYVRTRYGNEC